MPKKTVKPVTAKKAQDKAVSHDTVDDVSIDDLLPDNLLSEDHEATPTIEIAYGDDTAIPVKQSEVIVEAVISDEPRTESEAIGKAMIDLANSDEIFQIRLGGGNGRCIIEQTTGEGGVWLGSSVLDAIVKLNDCD